MAHFVEQLIELVRDAPTWISLLILFGASCIEYIFPPFPGDTVLVAGGFFAARGVIPLGLTAAVLIIGSTVGCVIGWTIGRFFGARFISRHSLTRLENAYARYGNWMLIFNRFLPGVRGAFMIASGMARISLVRVVVLGALSAVLWNSLLIGVGYFFSANLETLMSYMQRYSTVVLILLGVIAIAFVMKKFWPLTLLLFTFSMTSCECAKKTPTPTSINFLEASSIVARYEAVTKKLIVKVMLQEGVHAYAPGETVGRPVELIVLPHNGWQLQGAIEYPAGSPMLENEFTITAPVGGGHGRIQGVVKLQLCTDYACDKPREHGFDVNLSP